MLRIDILSAVPNLLDSPFNHSILKRAQERKLLDVHVHDIRAFGVGKHKQIDDYAYGGGAGMVMMCEPLAQAIESIPNWEKADDIIYLAPDGETWNQGTANKLSLATHLILICGHYKGIDERIRTTYVTREVSIGDYVLSGGELGAAILVDSIGRLIPGALNNESSALTDSFQDGLLAPPVYTRPETWRDQTVPEILRSGNASKIQDWKDEQREKRTQERRPDLLE
jgi:tRNA (guanine37-N1)-methyltransferase